MFCPNCGKETENGWKKCAFCGAVLESGEKTDEKNRENKRKKGGIKKIIIVIIALVFALIFITAISGDDSDDIYNKNLELVQNGYLGNYKTVGVKEVLENTGGNNTWNGGEAKNADRYIIEFENDIYKIQFQTDVENQTFKVSGMVISGEKETEPFQIKLYIDGIYKQYAEAYPEKGLVIDTSTDNDTLEGTAGPIYDVENGEMYELDILDCMGKNIDELNTLGIQIQTYEEDRSLDKDKVLSMRFDSEKRLISVMINGPRNMVPCVAGVRIGDSKESAVTTLEAKGLKRDEDIGQNLSYITEDGRISVLLQWSIDLEKIINIDCELQEESSVEEETETTDNGMEYILPDSDKRQITEEEIADFTDEEKQLAINEIYAKHGRLFNNIDMQTYFDQKSWYNGTILPEEFDDALLNDYEKKNIELLSRKEEVNNDSEESINFIGITGEYQAGSDLESGLINIFTINNDEGSVYLEMGTQELPGILRKIEARIVDNNTIVGSWGNATFTLVWSEPGAFVISREGRCENELRMDEITDNVKYVNASYYHVS